MDEKTANDYISLWNQASIKVLDVRHVVHKVEDDFRSYRIPASMFLFSARGSALVLLDRTEYLLKEIHLMHVGKGSILDIVPIGEEFEYYLIFYRASIPHAGNQKGIDLMAKNNPFQKLYSFSPSYPITLFHQIQTMHKAWNKSMELEKFHVKSLFYQFIYSILIELHRKGVDVKEPNLIDQVTYYIQENYSKPITLESLAQTFSYSAHYLSTMFKQSIGYSPIDYLIRIRLDRASNLLVETNASLRYVASSVGYQDVYYFSRLFKKKKGVSPVQYRKSKLNRFKTEDSPGIYPTYSIEARSTERYIVNDIDNHYHFIREGDLLMNKRMKSSIATSLLLCLTLLLSACSGGAPNNTTSGGTETSVGQNQTVAEIPKTRTISTVKGDVEVPMNPKRVVVLYYLGDVYSLGIMPIGVSEIYDGAAFQDELSSIQSLGHWIEPSPEAVLSLDPDLIIVPAAESYEILNKVAPTVLIPFEKMTLEERMQKLGEVLGKEGEAQELMDNFYAKVEEGKQKLKDAGIYGKSVSIMEGDKGTMNVIASKKYGRGSEIVYQYLEMKGPEIIQNDIEETEEILSHDISFEKLPEYAGDYIIRSSYEGMTDLSNNPIWRNLSAVKEGRQINIDFGLSYYTDIYSLDKQLDFIVESLLATVEE